MRKRKFLCRSIILVTFQILCFLNVACSKPRIEAGDVSKIIKLSGDTEVEIIISEKPEDMDVFLEAQEKVSNFIELYDIEYVKPDDVIFGNITQAYIYGCQQDNIIYVDNTQPKDKMLATIVHELLHLQNPDGLDSETEMGIIGHNLTEAIVEKMTIEITNQPETKRTQLLSEWSNESTYQIMCEAFFSDNPDVLEELLNDGELHEVVYQEKEYSVTTAEYFRIAFDRWMIIQDAETHFGKLRGERTLGF